MPALTVGNATAAKRRSAGHGDELQRRPRDHAERALRADEQLRQLGPIACRGTRDRVRQAAGRRRHAQRQHEVLDLAVAGGEHARAAGGDVAADRRPLDRRRVVRQHQPAGVQLGLELAAVLAGLHGHRHRDVVDLDHLGRASAGRSRCRRARQRAALGARAAAPRDHRHAVLVRDRQHRCDVLLGAWPYDHVRSRDRRPGGLRVQRRPVRVGRICVQLGSGPL